MMNNLLRVPQPLLRRALPTPSSAPTFLSTFSKNSEPCGRRFLSSSSHNNGDKPPPLPAVNVPPTTATSTKKDYDEDVFDRSIYVHPLSQVVLQYFQESKHDWIVSQRLDEALTLHRDGSFQLRFPSSSSPSSSSSSQSPVPSTDKEDALLDFSRIWTSYDETEKKHWLTVKRGPLQKRFLLQDNMLPAWNHNRKSLPERIHSAVDDLILAVNQMDQEKINTTPRL